GAVAHGGDLHSGAHIVEKKSDLFIVGAAGSFASDEVANFRITAPVSWPLAAPTRHVVDDPGRWILLKAAKLGMNGDHVASVQSGQVGLEFSNRVVMHAELQPIGV